MTLRGKNIWLREDENFGKFYTFCKDRADKVCHFVFHNRRITGSALSHDLIIAEHLRRKEALQNTEHRHELPTVIAASTRSTSPPPLTPPPTIPISQNISRRDVSRRVCENHPLPRSSPDQRDVIDISNDEDLDIGSSTGIKKNGPGLHLTKFITVLVYQNATTSETGLLHLRKATNVLVLGDHKVQLGLLGLEMTDRVQCLKDGVWKDIRWNEFMRVDAGDLVLLKPKGLHVEM
ncbi:hypothetical protein BT96DRAFT_999681 [Gymnopus androsaceus JB14]|uniref:Uncharacterized protein n=1 Tax=Gymnopus androsaceus JB14 TaxID=1447944 RepID=A0A6A4H4V5_9AGAR|nr:hypothetical protein BT96DRAFT_999681 [Gymnopus androsaceus JB14]